MVESQRYSDNFGEVSLAVEGHFMFNYKQESRRLQTYTWTPVSKIVALAFLCHGYGESLMPYYDHVATAGVERGILSFGHDHTGHGLSEGERVQVESMEEYVRPVLEHCALMRSKYPGIPIFIIGHSFGGMIAVNAAIEDGRKDTPMLKGLVLVGPFLEPDPRLVTPFRMFLASVVSQILPGLQLGEIDPEQVTSNKTWVRRMKADKNHWHGGFKALHSHVSLIRLKEMKEEYAEIMLPLLILHGEKDQLSTPEGSRRFFKAVSSTDKHLQIYPRGLHNLFLESEPISSQAINQTWSWINDRH